MVAVLCRAEAKKLYASKAAFDQLGVKLVTVVHEMPKLELEVTLQNRLSISNWQLVLPNRTKLLLLDIHRVALTAQQHQAQHLHVAPACMLLHDRHSRQHIGVGKST